jgi:hypothetical protein
MTWAVSYLICFAWDFFQPAFVPRRRALALHLPHFSHLQRQGPGCGRTRFRSGTAGPSGEPSQSITGGRTARISPFNLITTRSWRGSGGRFSADTLLRPLWFVTGLVSPYAAGLSAEALCFFSQPRLISSRRKHGSADYEMTGVLGGSLGPDSREGTGEIIYSQPEPGAPAAPAAGRVAPSPRDGSDESRATKRESPYVAPWTGSAGEGVARARAPRSCSCGNVVAVMVCGA